MADLIVIEYDDMHTAEEMRLKLQKMHRPHLVDMEDAVVAVKDERGNVKINQTQQLSAIGTLSGGYWGALLGIIFLSPLWGVKTHTIGGAVCSTLNSVGINHQFMENLTSDFKNGSSLLLILIRRVKAEWVLAELAGSNSKILKTSLILTHRIRNIKRPLGTFQN